jgi:hypothetical protein
VRVRPIQGSFDPYRRYLPSPPRDRTATGSTTTLRVVPRADAPESAADTELSVRILADGGSISVKRRTVADTSVEGGRRTVGIDAVVR